jgi:ribosomal protein S27E
MSQKVEIKFLRIECSTCGEQDIDMHGEQVLYERDFSNVWYEGDHPEHSIIVLCPGCGKRVTLSPSWSGY